MPRFLTLALAALLVVSSAGLAAADTTGNPVLSVHLPDNRVETGEETTLELFVLNGGEVRLGGTRDTEARVTTARQVVVSLGTGAAPMTVETGPRPVGNVPEGVVGPVTFSLSVRDNAAAGTYRLPVGVSYVYTNEIETDDPDEPEHHQRSSSFRTTVDVIVEPSADFEVANVTSTLAVGDEGTVRGTVTNTGEAPVRNAVVIFTGDNPNLAPVETEFAVGDLRPGRSATFAFDAEVSDSADAGPRQLTFEVRYRDTDDEVRRSDPLDARVEVGQRRDVFSVEPVSGAVTGGKSGTLELRVTNTGDEPVSDVSAKLFTDDPLASSDDEAFVDRLGPGESATIRFALSAAPDALEKVYPVSLDFQYDDAEGDTRLSDTFDVPVQVREPQDTRQLPVSTPLAAGGAVAIVVVVILGIWLWRRD